MKQWLIEMLICPGCLPEEIELRAEVHHGQAGEIIDGTLTCPHCDGVYLVKEGIAFLDPSAQGGESPAPKYETAPVLSSYLWSHYGDLLGEAEASSAYVEWAELMNDGFGIALECGSAFGRFSFEVSRKSDFVVGLDNSVSFVRAARELMLHGRKKVALREEGLLSREMTVVLPEAWLTERVEFIVGNALALPFRCRTFSTLASLNLIDKVLLPLKHLRR
jgi:uncharacterized protein YbaR (Trm112 family)